jgi:hypothetical protein
MTVMTLGQTIRLEAVEEGSELMAWSCFKGRNLSETGLTIKRKRPKNGPSRDIAEDPRNRTNTGFFDVRDR